MGGLPMAVVVLGARQTTTRYEVARSISSSDWNGGHCECNHLVLHHFRTCYLAVR